MREWVLTLETGVPSQNTQEVVQGNKVKDLITVTSSNS